MRIVHMKGSFGTLRNRELTLGEGLNIIEAPNEGGKSTWSAFLRSMLFETEASYSSSASLFLLGQPMKMAAIMMAIIPIMLMFPFFQKYFAKGILMGAVKG